MTSTSAPSSFSWMASECPMNPAPPTSAMRFPATSTTDGHLRQHSFHGLNDPLHVGVLHVRPHREGDRAVADRRRYWARTKVVAIGFAVEARVRQRLGVVDTRAHALRLERVDDLLAPLLKRLVEHRDQAVVARPPLAVVP